MRKAKVHDLVQSMDMERYAVWWSRVRDLEDGHESVSLWRDVSAQDLASRLVDSVKHSGAIVIRRIQAE